MTPTALHQGLAAMMAGTNRDAFKIEPGAHVESLDARSSSTKGTAPTLLPDGRRLARREWPKEVGEMLDQLRLMLGERGPIDFLEPFQGGGQADGAADIGRSRLELQRRRSVGGFLECHGLDHVAAGLPGRHCLEVAKLAVENSNAHRPENLVAGKCVKIAIEVLHVDFPMGNRRRRRRRRRPHAGAPWQSPA